VLFLEKASHLERFALLCFAGLRAHSFIQSFIHFVLVDGRASSSSSSVADERTNERVDRPWRRAVWCVRIDCFDFDFDFVFSPRRAFRFSLSLPAGQSNRATARGCDSTRSVGVRHDADGCANGNERNETNARMRRRRDGLNAMERLETDERIFFYDESYRGTTERGRRRTTRWMDVAGERCLASDRARILESNSDSMRRVRSVGRPRFGRFRGARRRCVRVRSDDRERDRTKTMETSAV